MNNLVGKHLHTRQHCQAKIINKRCNNFDKVIDSDNLVTKAIRWISEGSHTPRNLHLFYKNIFKTVKVCSHGHDCRQAVFDQPLKVNIKK